MKTRLSVMGLVSDLHAVSVPHSLDVLRGAVAELAPDLLCLEISRQAWERDGVEGSPLPVREALGPVAEMSDIVVVPVASSPREHHQFSPQRGPRKRIAGKLDQLHCWVLRRSSLRSINGSMYAAFCHSVCSLEETFWDKSARQDWEAENRAMLENIRAAVRRDPGCRVIVAAQCHRKHWLDARLKRDEHIDLVDYWGL